LAEKHRFFSVPFIGRNTPLDLKIMANGVVVKGQCRQGKRILKTFKMYGI
jgi:hypothetical protein